MLLASQMHSGPPLSWPTARSHWRAQILGRFSRQGVGAIEHQVILADCSVFVVRSETTFATGSSVWYRGSIPLGHFLVDPPGGMSAHSWLGFRTAARVHGPYVVRNIPPPVPEVNKSNWLIISPWLAWLIVSIWPIVWVGLRFRRRRARGRGFPAIQPTTSRR